VALLIELLECLEKKITLPHPDTDKVTRATENYLAHLEAERKAIMEGDSAWRKWKARLASRAIGKPVGKAAIDYNGLGRRSMISIESVFKNWDRVSLTHQKIIPTSFKPAPGETIKFRLKPMQLRKENDEIQEDKVSAGGASGESFRSSGRKDAHQRRG
jgi:hypothetical protein